MTISIFVVAGLAIGTFFVGRAGNEGYTHIRPRQRCTKDLPPQSWMHCSACVYTAAPRFVAHDPCTNLREATGPWS